MVPDPLIRSRTWEAVIISRAEGKNMAKVAKAAPITPLILHHLDDYCGGSVCMHGGKYRAKIGYPNHVPETDLGWLRYVAS